VNKREFSDACKKAAITEAFKGGAFALAVAGGAVLFATKTNANFKRFTSLSAKLGIPVTCTLGLFTYRYEIVLNDAPLYPSKYGIEGGYKLSIEADANAAALKPYESMHLHHKVANWLYDNPFSLIMGLGFPFAGFIYKSQMKHTHLSFSQKIMHARVIAQGGVLTILITTMLFRNWMDQHGRFPDPNAHIRSEQEQEESCDYSNTGNNFRSDGRKR